jgi:hypothetical protein
VSPTSGDRSGSTSRNAAGSFTVSTSIAMNGARRARATAFSSAGSVFTVV